MRTRGLYTIGAIWRFQNETFFCILYRYPSYVKQHQDPVFSVRKVRIQRGKYFASLQ